jgi:hypothetical protein
MSSSDAPAAKTVPYPHPAYAWYVVVVLLLAYILAFIDREIIALLVPDIKASLQISDTQMSLLLGGAFAVFYTFFGVAIAWLADRGNRRLLIFWGIVFWSLMTAACGFATSYAALFLARVGVGAGESALNPSALSLLKDYFPPEKIGRAIGLYTAGVSSGSGLAFIFGGAVYPKIKEMGPVELPLLGWHEPWQLMFIYVGLPGLLVALLVLTIREPVRREFLVSGLKPIASPVNKTLAYLFDRWRAFLVLFFDTRRARVLDSVAWRHHHRVRTDRRSHRRLDERLLPVALRRWLRTRLSRLFRGDGHRLLFVHPDAFTAACGARAHSGDARRRSAHRRRCGGRGIDIAADDARASDRALLFRAERRRVFHWAYRRGARDGFLLRRRSAVALFDVRRRDLRFGDRRRSARL